MQPAPKVLTTSPTMPMAGGGSEGHRSLKRRMVYLLMAIGFLVYANTLDNDYAYDDMSVITNNTIVTKGITAIPEIFSTPYRRGFFVTSNDLYRPLSLVMFAVEYHAFNASPAAGHFFNVLFYLGCVLLLFLFLDRLFEEKKMIVAFIASFLFALHPIHTEVVANIKSRDELLCFFFSLLSLNVFIKYSQSGKSIQLIAGACCFFLALLSKETAICLLAIIPLVFFFYRNENRKRGVNIAAVSVIPVLVFLAIRYSVLHTYHAADTFDIRFMDNQLINAPSFASALATKILVLGYYLKMLIIPYPLLSDYSFNSIPFADFGDIFVLLSAAAYLLIIVLGIYRLIKFRRDPYAFGILFFLVAIFLFSNIPFLIGAAMAERFIFFASAGFCLIAALFIERLLRLNTDNNTVFKNKRALYVLVSISLVYGIIIISRNEDWHDSITLYRNDVEKAPRNARLHFFLANDLMLSAGQDRLQVQEAMGHLQQSLSVYPRYSEAHKVLGNGYFMLADTDSAEYHLKLAHELNPEDMEAINNLGVVYFNAQKYPQAIELNKKTLSFDDRNLSAYNNMGICYLRMQKYDSAIYILNQGIAIDAAHIPFRENLAAAYKMKKATDSL